MILLVQNILNGSDQGVHICEQFISAGRSFQVLPKALNWIELRTVLRQEHRKQPIFQNGECCLAGKAMVDGAIVQHQDQRAFARMLLYQMIQKGNEGFTVALVCYLIDNFVGDPVVGSKEMTPLLLTWGGNAFLAASLHPAGNQYG